MNWNKDIKTEAAINELFEEVEHRDACTQQLREAGEFVLIYSTNAGWRLNYSYANRLEVLGVLRSIEAKIMENDD